MDNYFFDLIGGTLGNDYISQKVQEKLEEKYKEQFESLMIGGREFNSESIKLFVRPKNNKSLIFNVSIDSDENIEDDYYYRKTCNELEMFTENNLKQNGITAISRVTMIKLNTLLEDKSLNDLIKENGEVSFLSYIVLRGTEEMLKNSFDNFFVSIKNNYKKIKLNTYVVYLSNEDYDKFYEENCFQVKFTADTFSTYKSANIKMYILE